MENYYKDQLSYLNNSQTISIKVVSDKGEATNWMALNEDCVEALQEFMKEVNSCRNERLLEGSHSNINNYLVPDFLIKKYIPAEYIEHLKPQDVFDKRLPTGQAAELLGLKNYDVALPQDWVDEFIKMVGKSPLGHFVWAYDKDCPRGGGPKAVTREGLVMREIWFHLENANDE